MKKKNNVTSIWEWKFKKRLFSMKTVVVISFWILVIFLFSGCASVTYNAAYSDRNSSAVTTGVVTAAVSNALVPVPGGALSAGLIAGGAMYMMCSSSDEPHCKPPEKTNKFLCWFQYTDNMIMKERYNENCR